MRLLQALIAAAFVISGVLFSALNPAPVSIDFHFFVWTSSLGVAILLALLAGTLLGGLAVSAAVAWPLGRRLRKLQRQQATASKGDAAAQPHSATEAP